MLISKPKLNVLKILLIIAISNIFIFSCSKKNIKKKSFLDIYKGRIYLKSESKNYKSYFTLKEHDRKIVIYFYTKFGNDLGFIKYNKFKNKDDKFKFSFKDKFVNVDEHYKKLFNNFFDTFKNNKNATAIRSFDYSLELSEEKIRDIPKIWKIKYRKYKLKIIFYE